jgi:sulfoxide reductase heme-binding subunit YedZ
VTAPAPLDHGWWLASRAAGLVALVLVTASILLGLAMAGRVSRRPGLARKLAAIHEHTALAALVAIAVHGLALLGDPWLRPGFAGIAVPFAGAYRPVWTGLGIAGGYLATVLGLSFYFRRRIGPGLWRRLHRFTLAVWVVALIHTIGAGTDARTPWLREFMMATTVPIAVLLVRRIYEGRRRAGANERVASTA